MFDELPAPARYKLVFGLARRQRGGPLLCENDWDFWVYPARVDSGMRQPASHIVQDLVRRDALAELEAGAKVLWLLSPDRVAPDRKLGKVELGFSSIFWNTAWTRRQAPHTLGILCDPETPALCRLSHRQSQQLAMVVSRPPRGAMILDDLPSKLRPTVQVIDDWFTARKLGLVVRSQSRPGRLLVCSIDLNADDLESNPVARQFRLSLLRYIASDRFQPAIAVSADALRRLAIP